MRVNRQILRSFGAIAVAIVLSSCFSRVNCRLESHVSLASLVRKIEFPDVKVADSKILSGTEVHATPVFEHLIRPSTHCYWYIEVAPTRHARIPRRGVYLFDAETGKVLSYSVNIINVDYSRPPTTRR